MDEHGMPAGHLVPKIHATPAHGTMDLRVVTRQNQIEQFRRIRSPASIENHLYRAAPKAPRSDIANDHGRSNRGFRLPASAPSCKNRRQTMNHGLFQPCNNQTYQSIRPTQSVPRRERCRQSEHLIMASKKIVLDLTDLVSSLIWHGNVSGIQRVQIAVGRELVHSGRGTTISLFDGRFACLDNALSYADGDCEAVTDHVRQIYAGAYYSYRRAASNKAAQFMFRLRRRLKRDLVINRARRHLADQVAAGDLLVSAGAYWQLPWLVDLYQEAAERGVQLAGLAHDIFFVTDPINDAGSSTTMKRWLSLKMSLLAVSRFTRDDILKADSAGQIRLFSREIEVVPLAHEFPNVERDCRLPRPQRLRDMIGDAPYALVVGAGLHRNHRLIRAAWQKLAADGEQNLPYIVFASRHPEKQTPWDIGFASPGDSELAALYSNCQFSFFPSIQEGWGLPVGESLWFSRPCITSTAASLPEVGGDLCLYTDPEDVDGAAAAVRFLLQPQNLHRSVERIHQSPLRRWRDTAQGMVASLEAIAARGA